MTYFPIKQTKHNIQVCNMYDYARDFYEVYKKPSDIKVRIYNEIREECSELNGFGLRCNGNCFTFTAYFLFRKDGKLFIRRISKYSQEDVEIVQE